MIYTLEEIKKDLNTMTASHFYEKYILSSDNWYFRNVLSIPENTLIDSIDNFKHIISNNMRVDFNAIMLVGSGKVGYSLSPKKPLKQFQINTDAKDCSDIDIAIISEEMFEYFWQLFRKKWTAKNSWAYTYVEKEIYRGFINECEIDKVEACRNEWKQRTNVCNRLLKGSMCFEHRITYRIYRRMDDFEEYNIQGIQNIMNEVSQHGL